MILLKTVSVEQESAIMILLELAGLYRNSSSKQRFHQSLLQHHNPTWNYRCLWGAVTWYARILLFCCWSHTALWEDAGRALACNCSTASGVTGSSTELMFSSCIVLARHLKHTIDVKGVIYEYYNLFQVVIPPYTHFFIRITFLGWESDAYFVKP